MSICRRRKEDHTAASFVRRSPVLALKRRMLKQRRMKEKEKKREKITGLVFLRKSGELQRSLNQGQAKGDGKNRIASN